MGGGAQGWRGCERQGRSSGEQGGGDLPWWVEHRNGAKDLGVGGTGRCRPAGGGASPRGGLRVTSWTVHRKAMHDQRLEG